MVTSDSNGNFTFSVTQSDSVTVYIPEYNGNSWRSVLSVASVTTSDLSSPATIYSYTDASSVVHDFKYNAITDDGGQWIRVLQKVNNIVTINAGPSALNGVFQQFCTGNVKYIVNGITYNYYQRLTNKASFDFYTNFASNWGHNDNILNTDFKMYSTYDDLLEDTNAWQYCDYNNANIGYPGHCGIGSAVLNMWTGYITSTPINTDATSTEIWMQVYPDSMQPYVSDVIQNQDVGGSSRRLLISQSTFSGVTVVHINSRCGKSHLLLSKPAGEKFPPYEHNIQIIAGRFCS